MTDSVTKHVLSVVSTGGHLLADSCVRWAPDNSIAVVTDRHILTLTPLFDPTAGQSLRFAKNVITNAEKPMIFDCGITVQQVLDKCKDSDQQHVIMCDPTLAGETSNSANFQCYRRAEWSPVCGHFGCFIAVLTLDHRLVIYCRKGYEWKPNIDLSALLNQNLKNSWIKEKTSDFETYKSRMYSLATFCICWSQDWNESNDRNVCQLMMASKNGLITVWDITIGSDTSVLKMSADLIHKWDTNLDQITCLKSFEQYLIVSSIKGSVCVFHTDFDRQSKTSNPLFLWSEEDFIQVNDFAIKSMDNNVFEVVFTKSDYVIVCRFSGEEGVMSSQIVSGVHQMRSTAICPINDAKYLLSSEDGRLIELDIDDELTVKQSEIGFDGITSDGMSAHGVDSSFNGALSVMVESISRLYDHLLVKEPIRIIIFSNLSLKELFDTLLRNFLSEDQSMDRKISFDEYYDYLCCAQSFLCTTSSANSDLTSYLLNLTENQILITECIHDFKLKIIRFLLKSMIANHKELTLRSGVESTVRLCEDIIRKLYFEEVVQRLVTNTQTLTPSECQSLKAINSWHLNRFGQPLIISEDLSTAQELCPICGKEISFESHLFGECPQSHRFDRCFKSMVLLDLVHNKYNKCVRCRQSLLVRTNIWDSSPLCLFCS